MRIDPAVAALQADPASQRRSQAALEKARDDWRVGVASPVLDELENYGEGTSLGDCPALEDSLVTFDGAQMLVTPLVESMQAAMGAHPLGQVPFRHQHSGGISVIQIATSGSATLSLVTYAAISATPPPSVCLSDGERHEIVLAGSGKIRLFEIVEDRETSVTMDCEDRVLAPGDAISLPNPAFAKQVIDVAGRLSILRLSRSSPNPAISREFRVSDGALVHRASGDRSESRDELAMTLLARMGRRDAAPAMSAIAQDGSDHLRWQAVRNCMSLDTASGFAELTRIARDPADGLCDAASVLRARLIEAHPMLHQLEDVSCPA